MNDFIAACLRLIPPGTRGKTRVARLFMKDSLARHPKTLNDRLGFHYKVPDSREPIAFHLAVDGVYEPDTLAVVLDQLHPGGVFVDIGANIGVFSMPAAKRVGKEGRVLAAEASADVFPYLRHNLTQNGVDDVIILNCAICDITGCVPFYRAPSEKFGMGSLDAQFHGETTEVQARTLDDVLEETRIRHVDLLKVDVEGFELTVFRGAWKLLTGTCPPLILFEFCDWAEARVPSAQAGDAQRFLLDRGYSICRLSDFLRDRRPLHEPLKTGSAMLAAWHGKSNVQ